jgi:hypothetical protein
MTASSFVMPGLDPGIHVFLAALAKAVDGRVKPGHDGVYYVSKNRPEAIRGSFVTGQL